LDNYNNINYTGAFIGQYEIINTCKALRCYVSIYNLNTNADNYDIFNYKYETMVTSNDIYNPFWPIILIGWVNHNHYELLLPVNMKEEEYSIEMYFLNNNKLNNIKNNINEINSKYICNNDLNQNDNLTDKLKLELKTFLKIDKSIYPPLKGSKHVETKLEDIKNFLLSSKNYNSNLKK